MIFKQATYNDWNKLVGLYEQAFPVNERQPNQVIANRLEQKECKLYVADMNNTFLGFAILWNFESNEILFLDYLAVDENYRNQGIGKFLMAKLIDEASENKYRLLIEIENPNEGGNLEERNSRYEFYKRFGFKHIAFVDYMLPPLNGSDPTSMFLLTLPEIFIEEKDKLCSIIKELYAKVYNRLDDDWCLLQVLKTIK